MSTTRCAVLGKPIGHSLSPVLHRAAYDALGSARGPTRRSRWTRTGCPSFLAGLDASWRGLSLTMPLKRPVLQLLDSVSPIAEAAGAVNTVLLGDGLRIGDNTDVPGAAAAIRERYDGRVRSAVVVGGGATAASVALALGELGCWVVDAAGARRGAGRGHGAAGDPQRGTAARGRAARRGAARGRHRGLDDPRRGADPRPRGSPGRHPGRLRRRLRDLADAPGALGRPRPHAGQRTRHARAPGGAAGGPDDRPAGDPDRRDARRRRAGDRRAVVAAEVWRTSRERAVS